MLSLGQGVKVLAYQAVFKRYELKYLLSVKKQERLLRVIEPYMLLDQYGCTTIRNLYFDTPDYRLIRHSVERPVFKEKLRLRSYRQLSAEEDAFVEIKRKYRSQVYKRRLAMPEGNAVRWLRHGTDLPPDSQIGREIEYMRSYYKTLQPQVYLSYDRCAYDCRQGGDFRITFDRNICARRDDLSLSAETGGTLLLPEDRVLMEVKTSGAMPLWLVNWLSQEKIYKTSFSKYGTAYRLLIYEGESHYV